MVPRDRPRPKSRYCAAPRSRITGTVARLMTLLTTVGQPRKPSSAGSGGFARTTPRLPSSEFSNDVSSPQT